MFSSNLSSGLFTTTKLLKIENIEKDCVGIPYKTVSTSFKKSSWNFELFSCLAVSCSTLSPKWDTSKSVNKHDNSGPQSSHRFRADSLERLVKDVAPPTSFSTFLFCSCNWSIPILENSELVFWNERCPSFNLTWTSGHVRCIDAKSNQYAVTQRE